MELGSGRNKNLAPVQAYESTINNFTGSVLIEVVQMNYFNLTISRKIRTVFGT